MTLSGERPSQLIYSIAQSVGTVLSWNEDSIFGFASSVRSENLSTDFGLFLLADGMGGYGEGGKASSLAITVMADHIIRKVYLPLLRPMSSRDQEPLQEILSEGMSDIHERILRETNGAGTTLTAIILLGDTMNIAHIGDSRAYIVNPDEDLVQITQDQSYAHRLVELGQLSEEESRSDPRRNELFAALGKGEHIAPIIFSQKRPSSGYLFLCSDGVWEVLSKEDMLSCFSDQFYTDVMCDRLISEAIDAGATDNISVIVVKL